MTRAFALILGVVCGACVAMQDVLVERLPAPRAPVQAGLFCWNADDPIPLEFGGMTVLAADVHNKLFILERRGRAALIGEIVPGITCVLAEAMES